MAQNAHSPLRTLADIEHFERDEPFEARCPARTVYDVFAEAALRFPDRTALTMISTGDPDEIAREIAYPELLDGITRTANLFADLARPGAGVAYMLPNLVETHFVLWGAETSGYAVPINFLLQPDHIAGLLHAAKVEILVALGPHPQFDIWPKALEVAGRLPSLRLVRVDNVEPISGGGALGFLSALEGYNGSRLAFDRNFPHNHIAAYFHTGGTTGAPKLAAHTHQNQIVAAFGGKMLLDYVETDKLINGMPLFHVAAVISCGLSAFMAGANILILSAAGMRNAAMIRNYWIIISKYGATITTGVPTVISALLDVPVGSADISSLRYAITGAAPAPKALIERYEAKIKRRVHEIFGMTECGGLVAITPAAGERKIGSVGFRLPYVDVSIRRSRTDGSLGETCVPHEVGVLTVSGAIVTPGYLSNDHAIDLARPGPFNTGDLAYADEEGRIHIAGREKDLIIRSGHNIDPQLIENVLQQHPAVAIAAAVGQPDRYAGELPVCYVVLKPGCEVGIDDLRAFSQARIAERPAWPKEYYVIDSMPTTTVGKIFKPLLRAEAVRRLVSQIVASAVGPCEAVIDVETGGKRDLDVAVTLLEGRADEVRCLEAALSEFTFAYRVRAKNESELPRSTAGFSTQAL